jgi:hypothetical protein
MPKQDRPKEFSSYASRIAWNLLSNMAPPRKVGGDHLDNASMAALPGASADLRSFMESLYRDMYEAPASWKLPIRPVRAGDGRDRITAPRARMEAYLRSLWALGGLMEEQNGRFHVSAASWRNWLAEHKGRTVAAFLKGWPRLGLELRGEGTLEVAGVRFPRMPLALSLLSKACARDAKSGFSHFLRCDMRALDGDFSWTLADVLVSMEERDAEAALRLDSFVSGLGCRMEQLPPTLWWGEFRARYTHRKTGKALYGFTYEEGEFAIRAICDRTEDILPAVLAEPEPVRLWFLEGAQCRRCGNCGGPLELDLDGRHWTLCHGSYAGDRRPPYGHIDSVERILTAQRDLLLMRATAKAPRRTEAADAC